MHVCMYVCMYVCTYYVRMDVCMCVCMHVCMDVPYLCIYLSVRLSAHPFLSLSILPCLFVCISFYPTARLLVCQSVILFVSLPVTDQSGPNSKLFLLFSFTKGPIALPILLLNLQQDLILL